MDKLDKLMVMVQEQSRRTSEFEARVQQFLQGTEFSSRIIVEMQDALREVLWEFAIADGKYFSELNQTLDKIYAQTPEGKKCVEEAKLSIPFGLPSYWLKNYIEE